VKQKGLKYIHLNARSMLPKKEEIHWIINELNVDACCVSETWLDDTVFDADIALSGYTLVRKDRQCKKGGGVLIYIKQNLIFKERNEIITDDSLEMIWLEVKTKDGTPNMLISCIYRPPNSPPEYFNNILDTTERAISEDKEVILLGDMNIDYSLNENLSSNSIFLMESMFGFNQLILSPTRVTPSSSSFIDIILSTCPQHHVISGVHEINLSDHFMIYTCIDVAPTRKPHREIKYRNYKNFDEQRCLNDYHKLFDNIIDNFKTFSNIEKTNVDDIIEHNWTVWKNSFLEVSDKNAPIKISRLKNRCSSWITTDIIKCMHTRDYLHKKAIKSSDPTRCNQFWHEYRKYRNTINKTVKKAKRDYLIESCSQNNNNPKQFWKDISSILPRKNTSQVNNDICPNKFNEYFSSIGKEVASNIQTSPLLNDYLKKFPRSIHDFKFNHIENHFTVKQLKSLPKISKIDVLNFDSKLLNTAAEVISPSLTYLLNMSIDGGYVPIDWKLAKVTPAFKGKGIISSENNYRPLSVIACIAKIAEKSVQLQLLEYLRKHKFISIDQFAYLKYHSTQHCLHRLIDDVLENVNNKELTGMCFIDIKKCFDTIDHDILLFKLEKYGIQNNELNWFKSYLSNRKQVVVNNGKVSDKCKVNIGVPQGTILGPLLFLLYINDVSNSVSDAQLNIYADDVVVYCSSNDVYDLQCNLQKVMNNVYEWYKINKLALSTEKCSTMLVKGNNLCISNNIDIYLGNEKLNNVHSMKYLGVTIDDDLKWRNHLRNISKKVNINNARLRKTYNILPETLRLKMHNTISVPVIDYASTVWGDFSQSIINYIDRIEHMCARTITGNYNFIDYRGEELMQQLGMTFFVNRLDYYISVIMYKAIHGLVPDHIANIILFTYEMCNRNLRTFNNMDLYKPMPHCNLFKKSLQFKGPNVWNRLPLHVKESLSVETFK
jgi:exonuclease III